MTIFEARKRIVQQRIFVSHTPFPCIRYACKTRLKDGRVIDPAYLAMADRLPRWYNEKYPVQMIDSVAEVCWSSLALPETITLNIQRGGESLPDAWLYDLTFDSGMHISYGSAGDYDFPKLPNGCSASHVVACRPLSRRDKIDVGDYPDITHFLCGSEERR